MRRLYCLKLRWAFFQKGGNAFAVLLARGVAVGAGCRGGSVSVDGLVGVVWVAGKCWQLAQLLLVEAGAGGSQAQYAVYGLFCFAVQLRVISHQTG